jgi:hypothetical protein
MFRRGSPENSLLAMIAIIAFIGALLLPPVLVARRARHGFRPRAPRLAIAIAVVSDSVEDDAGPLAPMSSDGPPSYLRSTPDPSPSARLRSHISGAGPRNLVETVVRRE